MKRILLVLKNELVTVIARRSFWLTALGLPLFGALVFAVVGAINKSAAASQTVSQVFTSPHQELPEGFVDMSGIIQRIPPEMLPGEFVEFQSEAEARQALGRGTIAAYYIVAPDYLESGKITYIRPDFNPLASSSGQSSDFTWMLQTNLLGGNAKLAGLVNGPRKAEYINMAPESTTSATPMASNSISMWIPYAISILTFGLIMGSSSLLLSSVSKEKENRIMEVLLTSVTPRQLLTGKILGLGIAGLVQTVIWLGSSYALLSISGQTFKLPVGIHLPFSFIAWGLVFFLLGYAVYSSLMAGMGALVPNLREASQATIILMIPMMIPMMLSNSVFAMEPHGPIALVLSLFPLSAPVAMMARISTGGVPWWQIGLSALLVAATAVFVQRAVAGMFRAQALLSGQAFNVKRYFRALAGRE